MGTTLCLTTTEDASLYSWDVVTDSWQNWVGRCDQWLGSEDISSAGGIKRCEVMKMLTLSPPPIPGQTLTNIIIKIHSQVKSKYTYTGWHMSEMLLLTALIRLSTMAFSLWLLEISSMALQNTTTAYWHLLFQKLNCENDRLQFHNNTASTVNKNSQQMNQVFRTEKWRVITFLSLQHIICTN